MSSQHIQNYSKLKIERPKSAIFSWMFDKNNKIEKDKLDKSLNLDEAIPTNASIQHDREPLVPKNKDIPSEIKIPTRNESKLYTLAHDDTLSAKIDKMNQEYKRRSCYSANLSITTNQCLQTSLTRSASWQPSSSLNKNTDQSHTILKSIPDRRTSRNCTQDPTIQAKLNKMIQSEKTLKVTQIIATQQQQQ